MVHLVTKYLLASGMVSGWSVTFILRAIKTAKDRRDSNRIYVFLCRNFENGQYRRDRNFLFRAAPTLSAFNREEIPCALVAQPDFQFLPSHRKIILDDAHGAVMLPVPGQPPEQKLALDFLMLHDDCWHPLSGGSYVNLSVRNSFRQLAACFCHVHSQRPAVRS